MQPLGEALFHLRLLGLMAKTTDVDLVEAFAAGQISEEDWAEMINQCRACGCVEKCQRWLAAHDHAEAAPEGCNNADRLQQLHAKKEPVGG
ncbi:DUF6455 family protein [Phaeobacter sp. QD34_3]|uniref:DUF6455 family protein n=1 Tax=unclassified Phaeobacter TaxID=2621772 RepID=UPI00237F11AA|nr:MULTISPECIES: DUF6455 family protein [unclassified Phaeobacter]MDE4133937.1 DUF6455 family protein [Phaeobacter sp. QD34_3]MDE4137606.1 DUF6455 family protein [Phaeobacter sp. QD34_24]MDE4175618.1 DUF6455 family protein [Phaeobacter sp. PT47_59]